jgi:hypothetical protein
MCSYSCWAKSSVDVQPTWLHSQMNWIGIVSVRQLSCRHFLDAFVHLPEDRLVPGQSLKGRRHAVSLSVRGFLVTAGNGDL